MTAPSPPQGRPQGRLDELLGELGAPTARSRLDTAASGGDAFFTARVLGALPEPLRWTGASPMMRAVTLLAFHVAAAVVGVIVYRWASPQFVDVAASRAAEVASPWASSLALLPEGSRSAATDPAYLAAAVVVVVALVAFWATRSHTRAT